MREIDIPVGIDYIFHTKLLIILYILSIFYLFIIIIIIIFKNLTVFGWLLIGVDG
jgi:hypothetical protein